MSDTQNSTDDMSMEDLEKATAPDHVEQIPSLEDEEVPPSIAESSMTPLDTQANSGKEFDSNSIPEAGATKEPESPEAAAKLTPIEPVVVTQVITPSTPVAISEPAPVKAKVVVVESDRPVSGTNKEIIDSVIGNVGPMAKLYLNAIGEYMETMKPRRPVDVATGARHQVELYRALTGIINRLEDDFVPTFSTVLRLFEENNKGVFAESHVFRYFEAVSLNDGDRKSFMRIINLLKIAAPVKGREQAMRQVDFVNSLSHESITEPGRQRVAAFFNR
jgi:hypothetical protein